MRAKNQRKKHRKPAPQTNCICTEKSCNASSYLVRAVQVPGVVVVYLLSSFLSFSVFVWSLVVDLQVQENLDCRFKWWLHIMSNASENIGAGDGILGERRAEEVSHVKTRIRPKGECSGRSTCVQIFL